MGPANASIQDYALALRIDAPVRRSERPGDHGILAKWGEQFLNAQYVYSHTLSVREAERTKGGPSLGNLNCAPKDFAR
jgi:hypothetical protein